MNRMQKLSIVLISALVLAQVAVSQSAGNVDNSAKQGTFNGVITDSMCGAKHMMKDKSAAECTRICVKQGSDYALVVGNKVYTLKGNASDLDKYAGERVTVKGSVSGNTIYAESIATGKT